MRLKEETDNKWYPLRLFANYTVCCQCIMRTKEISGYKEKMKMIRNLYKDPIWDDFKIKGVTADWDRKFKIKYFLAKTGILPIIYGI